MHAFLPADAARVLPALGLLALVLVLAGKGTKPVSLAWALCIASAITAEAITFTAPPVFRMLALVFILLLGMKAIAHADFRNRGGQALTFPAYGCFAVLWLGMKPETFARRTRRAPKQTTDLLVPPLLCLVAGILILRYLPNQPWLVLPGLSLTFHFGLINLGAGLWRLVGFPTYPLFRNPFQAHTLGSFWSRLWNLGYVEMIARCVYRPLKKALPLPAASFLAFLFSGLLHEIAISLPVHRGYGLPTLYFALHGILTSLESRLPFPGRIRTLAFLVLPLPLLMHRAFFEGVLVPIANLLKP